MYVAVCREVAEAMILEEEFLLVRKMRMHKCEPRAILTVISTCQRVSGCLRWLSGAISLMYTGRLYNIRR